MLREIAIFFLLLALAGTSYAISASLQIPILDKIATSLAAIAGSYLVFSRGVILFITGMYRMGDRIEIDNRFGDVMDIGLMNTTLLEIRAWVAGDQPAGRIVMMPNGRILSMEIINYTRDHSFIWEEPVLPLTHTSNWKQAIPPIMEILIGETADTTARATEQIERIKERYYPPPKEVEPSIHLTPTDNWIELHIRYLTDVRERRAIHNQISHRIIDGALSEPDIVVASATMEISGRHEVHLTGSDRT